MHRSIVLFFCLALLAPGPSRAAKKRADDKPAIRWSHPWVPERYFDYRHKRWKFVKEAELGALIEDMVERHTWSADGTLERHQSFTLRVRDPDRIPPYWHVVTRSPVVDTEILELDIRWESGGKTRVYGEADLIERSEAPFDDYITDDVGLWLPLDRSRPGVLHVSVTTEETPLPGFADYLGGVVYIQPGPYTKNRTLVFEVPKDVELDFHTQFFSIPEIVLEDFDAFLRYTVDFETLYVRFFEPSMPHPLASFPALWWSNQDSWEALSALASAVWEPTLTSTPAMDAWAAELVADEETVEGRARAIHDAVADGWDYLGFYPSASGWAPHPPSACFEARIGDCKDKTALMITLMRAVGIDAAPALVSAGKHFERPDLPAMVFNHVIVAVDDPSHPDGRFFLDSVDAGIGSRPVGDWLMNREALLVLPEGGGPAHIPPTPPHRWLEEDVTDVVLASDGAASATLRWRFVGHRANQRVSRRSDVAPDRWARQLRDTVLSAWPGAEILSLTEGPDPEAPDDAWLVEAEIRSDRLASVAGPHAVVPLPWLHERDPADFAVDRGRRVHPVVLDPLLQRSTIRLRLPPGASLEVAPGDWTEERDDWSATVSTASEGDIVTIQFELTEHPGHMDPGLEEARRNFVRAVRDRQRQPVVLRMGD